MRFMLFSTIVIPLLISRVWKNIFGEIRWRLFSIRIIMVMKEVKLQWRLPSLLLLKVLCIKVP